jgi:hypothetical protein
MANASACSVATYLRARALALATIYITDVVPTGTVNRATLKILPLFALAVAANGRWLAILQSNEHTLSA